MNHRHDKPATRPRRRSGKSLIELIAVISILAAVMAAGTRLMHVLFRAERTGTQQAAETAALAQLARQFRRDVHAADSRRMAPSPAGGDTTLELTLPGGEQVVYVPGRQSIDRRVLRGGEILSQQRFRLSGRTIGFEPSGDAAVTLVCEPSSEGASTGAAAVPRLPVRVLAVVGRDRRFERREE
ncbi:MAG TPA: hypothetical protein VML55_18155 [Planctomycetaceae bacterium]|nr:hypothetical protein [Planctomycetaceae bacterium]